MEIEQSVCSRDISVGVGLSAQDLARVPEQGAQVGGRRVRTNMNQLAIREAEQFVMGPSLDRRAARLVMAQHGLHSFVRANGKHGARSCRQMNPDEFIAIGAGIAPDTADLDAQITIDGTENEEAIIVANRSVALELAASNIAQKEVDNFVVTTDSKGISAHQQPKITERVVGTIKKILGTVYENIQVLTGVAMGVGAVGMLPTITALEEVVSNALPSPLREAVLFAGATATLIGSRVFSLDDS